MVELKRIELKGFKSIREMELEFRPLNVLIGANGAGKSNFVSVFALVHQIVSQNLQVYVGRSGGADALLYFGRKTTDAVSCQLQFGANGYRFRLEPTASNSLLFAEEECYFHAPDYEEPYRLSLGTGHSETRLHDPAAVPRPPGIPGHIIKHLSTWRVYHFHDTSESAKMRQTCDLQDNRALRPDAANLASFLYLLKQMHGDHYRNIVETVRMAAPFFDDFDLRPAALNKDKIRLEWREKGTDTYFGPETLSDGTLRLICLATVLLQPSLPSVVILDEPELGLHPAAIALLASLMKSAASKTQIVACTQSVTLVNQMEPGDVVVIDREGGPSTFRRLPEGNMKDWLEEYGLGDLWEKNVLGGRP